MSSRPITTELTAHPSIAGVIETNYRLVDVAQALGRSVQGLRALSRAGEFPRLFRVSRNDWRVGKDELERWATSRWEDPVVAIRRVDAVRQAIRQPAWRRRTRS